MIDEMVRSSLLWGVSGGLSFLVLLQAYQLITQQFIAPSIILVVTLLVVGCTAIVTHYLRPRLLQSNERP